MDYCGVEVRALRPSLVVGEFAMKAAQQALLDDHLFATGVPTEDFSVDDLLNLSNPEIEGGVYVEEEDEEDEGEMGSSSLDQADDHNSIISANLSGTAESSESHLADQLAVPDDDIAELEWLSHFVHDDLSESSLLCTAGEQNIESRAANRSKPEWRPRPPFFPSGVPSKARSKRTRAVKPVWRLGSPLTQSSPQSSSSSSPGFSSTPCLIFNNMVQTMELLAFPEPPMKKQKKKPAAQTGGSSGGSQFQRRCSHCQVQKTPQWRTGPLGAKTLCNACGVRYKSGRLFPEYRPACSPTFSGDVHSNSHRKVLEMRKRKEMPEPESMLTQMVSSFG